jgi:hypothetical protein
VRARNLVRRWEYRQRNHARGAWFRLRRLLADAASAWRIPEEQARVLVGEGFAPEAVGFELEPPITIVVVPRARIEAVASRMPLAPGLGADLLASRFLALVPWSSG